MVFEKLSVNPDAAFDTSVEQPASHTVLRIRRSIFFICRGTAQNSIGSALMTLRLQEIGPKMGHARATVDIISNNAPAKNVTEA